MVLKILVRKKKKNKQGSFYSRLSFTITKINTVREFLDTYNSTPFNTIEKEKKLYHWIKSHIQHICWLLGLD